MQDNQKIIEGVFGGINTEIVRGGFVRAKFAREVIADGKPLVGATKSTRKEAKRALLEETIRLLARSSANITTDGKPVRPHHLCAAMK